MTLFKGFKVLALFAQTAVEAEQASSNAAREHVYVPIAMHAAAAWQPHSTSSSHRRAVHPSKQLSQTRALATCYHLCPYITSNPVSEDQPRCVSHHIT